MLYAAYPLPQKHAPTRAGIDLVGQTSLTPTGIEGHLAKKICQEDQLCKPLFPESNSASPELGATFGCSLVQKCKRWTPRCTSPPLQDLLDCLQVAQSLSVLSTNPSAAS